MHLAQVFQQGDGVLIAVFLTLVLMSIITWTVLLIRGYQLWQAKRGNKKTQNALWSASSLAQAQQHAALIDCPISELTLAALKAHQNHTEAKADHLAAAIPLPDYLTRHMRHSMMQILRRFDGGLTALASIGATAPFIGLFGTVWGIYHALINISVSGQMSIAAVAGPIGEALVATAAGLFVAIPAVLGYNALVRGNKTLAQDLDGFAHDFHVQLLNSKE